jgi:hypothetical protein
MLKVHKLDDYNKIDHFLLKHEAVESTNLPFAESKRRRDVKDGLKVFAKLIING